MNHARVLITDYAWPDLRVEQSILGPHGVELVVAHNGDEQELKELATNVDVIITCFRRVSDEVLRAAARCRAIIRYGVGVDNIDVDTATALGMLVSNVPDYCDEEVADHALMLLLALNRRLKPLSTTVESGDLRSEAGTPWRLRDRTLGLVGYGRIGQALALRGHALGMRLLIAGIRSDPNDLPSNAGIAPNIDAVLQQSDIVSLHVPLTDQTRHLINARSLRMMKSDALFINTARGGLVDTSALLAALERGELGGAALDVTDPEPLESDHPLRKRPDVLITPHTAFHSDAAIRELARKAAERALAVINGERPPTIVNLAVLTSSALRTRDA
ncbi:MAG TPA: C-terminal binding protein [Nocardioidaceae bacterium]|nr:C-terminal binding protein [Nocardioidaceae bacterium]